MTAEAMMMIFLALFFSKAKIYIKGDQLIFIPHIGISRIYLLFYGLKKIINANFLMK